MKVKSSLLLFGISLLVSLSANANAATENTTARIELIDDVSITEVSNLDFATVLLGGVAGTTNVTLSTGDVRSVSGTGTATLVGGTASGSPAEYTISGTSGETVQITVDNVTSPNAGLALDPAAFTVKIDSDPEVNASTNPTFTLGVSASTLLLGGTMQVTEGGATPAVAGVYTTDAFDLNVIYQ